MGNDDGVSWEGFDGLVKGVFRFFIQVVGWLIEDEEVGWLHLHDGQFNLGLLPSRQLEQGLLRVFGIDAGTGEALTQFFGHDGWEEVLHRL